jgi:hypothetical protein
MKAAAFQATDKARPDFKPPPSTPLAAWCGASSIPPVDELFQIDIRNSLQKKIT